MKAITPGQVALMWQESEELRKQLRDEVRYLREQVHKANNEILQLSKRVKILERKHDG